MKWLLAFATMFTFASDARADRISIHGPPGSSNFGIRVAALPNGNIVIVDRDADEARGAVYLYGEARAT